MEVCQHLDSGCFDPNILAVNILLLKTNEPLQRQSDIQKKAKSWEIHLLKSAADFEIPLAGLITRSASMDVCCTNKD